jgi:hypothetical protein
MVKLKYVKTDTDYTISHSIPHSTQYHTVNHIISYQIESHHTLQHNIT